MPIFLFFYFSENQLKWHSSRFVNDSLKVSGAYYQYWQIIHDQNELDLSHRSNSMSGTTTFVWPVVWIYDYKCWWKVDSGIFHNHANYIYELWFEWALSRQQGNLCKLGWKALIRLTVEGVKILCDCRTKSVFSIYISCGRVFSNVSHVVDVAAGRTIPTVILFIISL